MLIEMKRRMANAKYSLSPFCFEQCNEIVIKFKRIVQSGWQIHISVVDIIRAALKQCICRLHTGHSSNEEKVCSGCFRFLHWIFHCSGLRRGNVHFLLAVFGRS